MFTRLELSPARDPIARRFHGRRSSPMPSTTRQLAIPLLLLACCLNAAAVAADPQAGVISKTQHFDADPGWEGYQNRIAPQQPRTIEQDFGYRESNFAGKGKGEI